MAADTQPPYRVADVAAISPIVERYARLEDGEETEWEVHETLRKIYIA